MSEKIRVLIVEDSALMRKAMKNILTSDKDIVVIDTARDGEEGVIKARELKPDVVTMDINMPKMDGLTAMQHILSENICPVIVVSSLTKEGALITFEALELGAFDYVPKPGGTMSININESSKEIISKVKAAANRDSVIKIKKRMNRLKLKKQNDKIEITQEQQKLSHVTPRIAVAIGVSTGGPRTLVEIISGLPENLGAALFIVQHMPGNFTTSFAKRLDSYAKFPLKEAVAGDVVDANAGYLAPGGFHLVLRKKTDNGVMIRLPTIPEHLFIPSVGVMMKSVLDIFGDHTIGVLLTGMGDDGADAMVDIKKRGGITIAESEETAIVFGMPKEAIDRGGADIVVPSYKVAAAITDAIAKINKR